MGWDDIKEATNNDAYLAKLRRALIENKHQKVGEMLSGKLIHCPTSKNGLSKMEISDLSLYHNCVMVRDRIWGPESLKLNFFNNLHLGHRGVDLMMRLAQRSAAFIGLA